jgi:hypothetical protein
LRVISAICVLCFALAVYSGHHIVSETHLHASHEPSRVPGMSKNAHDTAALEQAQRMRAARLTSGSTSGFSSTFDSARAALGAR